MAEGLNKAILIGNLGADPELKYTQNGGAVLKLRLATSESYLNKAGERQQRTEWHTVVVWGKRAEALNNILSKGRSICVEGRIQYRSWDDKDGNKRYATDINANNIVLLGGRRDGGGGGGGSAGSEEGFSEPPSDIAGAGGGGAAGGGQGDNFGDDDIPF